MLMITADMGGHQPHHIRTQVAVTPRPEHQADMVGQQAVSQQTNINAPVRFCFRRLRDTSHAPAQVAEMTLTSALIPLLSVYWHLRGALRSRVFFL